MDAAEVPPNALPVSPDRLKQEGDQTPPSGRASPPPNCAICLGACQNKSFTDSCLHQFCFNCLLTWSKIKAECPLCKQIFKSIIHNVRSNHQYEEYLIEQQQQQVVDVPVNVPEPESQRRFRYRTTITIPRREAARSAIQRLLVSHSVESAPPPRPDAFHHRRLFRQTVYRHNLWARPLPDFTGRLRECSPEFYRANEAQRYRLVPWLTRELDTLLSANHSHIAYVMARILDLLPVHPILSEQFRYELLPFFGDQTDHFVHELHCFACTPFDMLGYDRNVQYGPDPRLGANLNHVISSSDSDSGSDVVMVSAPPAPPPPPQHNEPYVIPIETISHSDTDDSSNEVVVTGFLKPPQDRTPEVVDLLASDSDVVLNEDTQQPSTSRQQPSASVKVKLTMAKRVRPPNSDSDDDYIPNSRRHRQKEEDEDYVPHMESRRQKRRHRSQSASTVSTRMDTPSPSESSWNPVSSTTGSRESWANSEEADPSYTPPPPDLADSFLNERSLFLLRESRKRKLQRRIRTEQRRIELAEDPSREDKDRRKKEKKSKKSKKKVRDRPSTDTRKGRSKKRSDKGRRSDRDIPSTSGSQEERIDEDDKRRASGSREERVTGNQKNSIKNSSDNDRPGTSGTKEERTNGSRKERTSGSHVDRYRISDNDHPSTSGNRKDSLCGSQKEHSKKLRSVVCSLPRHLLTIGQQDHPSTSGTRRPERTRIDQETPVTSSERLYEAPTPERPIQWSQTPERHSVEMLTPERLSQESLTPERLSQESLTPGRHLETSPRSEAGPNTTHIYNTRSSSPDSPEIRRRRAGRAQVISSDSEDDYPLNLCLAK